MCYISYINCSLSAQYLDVYDVCGVYTMVPVRRQYMSHDQLLWTPAQRKRASMLYFANVFFIFFYGRLILRPWLTEVRESFTRGGP